MTGGVRPSIECGIRSGPPMEDRFGAGEGQGLFSLPPTHTCPLYFSALQYDHYGLYCPGPLPHLPWQRLTNGRHWQDTEVSQREGQFVYTFPMFVCLPTCLAVFVLLCGHITYQAAPLLWHHLLPDSFGVVMAFCSCYFSLFTMSFRLHQSTLY